ncbi:MAG: FAD-binding oxidoreductase, partial [Kiritimatiellae bacterium]|nr:FAD-binding oxidoreductase [Kiritimatiellia bacterium]
GGPFSSADGKMDLIDLIVGSEGIFGVITQCTLKLQDKPKDHLDLFFSLPEETDAIKLRAYLGEHIDGGVESFSALEYFGINGRKYMKNEEVLFKGDDKVGVYVQVPLNDRELEDAAEEWLEMLVEADCNINDDAIILMDSDRDREIFQEARHSMPANSLEVAQHRGTFTIMTDALVPEDKFAEFMDFTNKLIDAAGMDYLSFGHLGDCHIHFMIMPTKEQVDGAVDVYDKIIAKSAELGGIYSGEHGTGKRKRKDFIKCHGERGVAEVRKTKAALDPDFLLNRGNVIEQ